MITVGLSDVFLLRLGGVGGGAWQPHTGSDAGIGGEGGLRWDHPQEPAAVSPVGGGPPMADWGVSLWPDTKPRSVWKCLEVPAAHPEVPVALLAGDTTALPSPLPVV